MSQRPATPVPDAKDVRENKVMAALAYILFFLPLIACPHSKYARFHANQGLILMLLGVVVSIAGRIPFIGGIIGFVGGLATLALFVIGLLNAAGGKLARLPIVGGFDLIL